MADNPFDFTKMFSAFQPDQMMRMWNPQAMMKPFAAPRSDMFDMEAVIQANQRNFEAMAEANRAAAQAYKDLLDKQMEIFEKMTLAARQQYEWAEDTAGPDTMKARTKAMNDAVEEALELMKKLAETTREANAEAYKAVQGQVKDAVDNVKKAGSAGSAAGSRG
ncbi:phasin family protein [Oceaniovalibus guishaninsula]|nr:phasin family protein [Oceaniovalibus guishaninsula]